MIEQERRKYTAAEKLGFLFGWVLLVLFVIALIYGSAWVANKILDARETKQTIERNLNQ